MSLEKVGVLMCLSTVMCLCGGAGEIGGVFRRQVSCINIKYWGDGVLVCWGAEMVGWRNAVVC